MGLKDDLTAYVKSTHQEAWTTRRGQKVPNTEDLQLSNDAVKLDATVLYADLADSTGMVDTQTAAFAAEVYKNYLYCAARIIRDGGGTITAFDGDRIMAVFLGDSKNTDAAMCGLKINWAVRNILRPAIKAQYPSNSFLLHQKIGIDTSSLFVARTGIRGSNDLVWVGPAANNAAKMAALPKTYPTYISEKTYNRLNKSSKYGGKDKEDMWTPLGSAALGYPIYGSTWFCKVS